MSVAAAVAQAFIELRASDPEAESALAVARSRLEAARTLRGLRRLRLCELRGTLPGAEELNALLHRSTRFYNPAKERCTLRVDASEPAAIGAGHALLLVLERGGERRPAAERWWRHETGERIEVCEGVVWALQFEAGEDASALAAELAVARDRQHGLFCNPHGQEWRLARASGAGDGPPLDWIGRRSVARATRSSGRGSA